MERYTSMSKDWMVLYFIENNSPSYLYSSKNLIIPFLELDKCGLNEIPSPPPIVLGTWILGSPVGSTVWVGLGGTVCWKKYVTVANSEVSKTTRQPQFALSASCLQVQEWSSQFLVKSAACCHTFVSRQFTPPQAKSPFPSVCCLDCAVYSQPGLTENWVSVVEDCCKEPDHTEFWTDAKDFGTLN